MSQNCCIFLPGIQKYFVSFSIKNKEKSTVEFETTSIIGDAKFFTYNDAVNLVDTWVFKVYHTDASVLTIVNAYPLYEISIKFAEQNFMPDIKFSYCELNLIEYIKLRSGSLRLDWDACTGPGNYYFKNKERALAFLESSVLILEKQAKRYMDKVFYDIKESAKQLKRIHTTV